MIFLRMKRASKSGGLLFVLNRVVFYVLRKTLLAVDPETRIIIKWVYDKVD